MQLPCNPATVLGDIYPREVEIYVHRKTWAQTFIAALFLVAENWKQLRCLLTGECAHFIDKQSEA